MLNLRNIPRNYLKQNKISKTFIITYIATRNGTCKHLTIKYVKFVYQNIRHVKFSFTKDSSKLSETKQKFPSFHYHIYRHAVIKSFYRIQIYKSNLNFRLRKILTDILWNKTKIDESVPSLSQSACRGW